VTEPEPARRSPLRAVLLAVIAVALLVLGAASVRVPEALDDRPALLLAILTAIALAGLVSAGWLTARLLRPLGALADAARRIGEGDLDVRAPAAGRDEIAALGAELAGIRTQADAARTRQDDVHDALERALVLAFLRRYVTWCARRGRYAQMNGAARLLRSVRRAATGVGIR
jgi:nitrogen fixation/metabolism regulation signal transduction histidine kinase